MYTFRTVDTYTHTKSKGCQSMFPRYMHTTLKEIHTTYSSKLVIYPSTFHIRSSISYQLHLNTAPKFQWTTWIHVSACKMWSPHFHPQWMILENLNLYNTTFPMYGHKSFQLSGGTSINNSAQLTNEMEVSCMKE